MTEIKALPSALISEFLLTKLHAFCHPARMTREHTAFDMGYEQCKTDLRDFLSTQLISTGDPTTSGGLLSRMVGR